MLVKTTVFEKITVNLNFYSTRKFYNLIKSPTLNNCMCALCKTVASRLGLCNKCSNELQVLGIEKEKPFQITYTTIDKSTLVSLLYQFDGSPYLSLNNDNNLSSPAVECKTCNLYYRIGSDKTRITSMILKIEMAVDANSIKSEEINQRHFLMFS
ncbi:MAG: hypothetical protein HY606_07360 [Planctomycetes bacterium]|nr:hypothetical protein [Planctomycetota bacterium]